MCPARRLSIELAARITGVVLELDIDEDDNEAMVKFAHKVANIIHDGIHGVADSMERDMRKPS
jgi:predicted TIM-barrel fold metal-dependent hydrolase